MNRPFAGGLCTRQAAVGPQLHVYCALLLKIAEARKPQRCSAPSRRMAPPGAAPQALDTRAAEPDLAPSLNSPLGGRRSRTSVDLSAEARALLSERFGGFLAAQAGVTVGLVRRAAQHPCGLRLRLVRASRVGRDAPATPASSAVSWACRAAPPVGCCFGPVEATLRTPAFADYAASACAVRRSCTPLCRWGATRSVLGLLGSSAASLLRAAACAPQVGLSFHGSMQRRRAA